MRQNFSISWGMVVSLAAYASAHTVFTTLWIDGTSQGDGTCVRSTYSYIISPARTMPLIYHITMYNLEILYE
ncbi:hypothetical protein F4803DRAFT_500993 [Xylaria telfairii]|nr:hypothetical protein F4803DRAFT_500993 [Xylaria telfairii]